MIYLQQGAVKSWGTYYHEAIHYLQHRDLYPVFYSTGGFAPFQVEGLTEYLTRRSDTKVNQERQTHGNYQAEFAKTNSWIGGNILKEDKLAHLNFKGTGLGTESASNAKIINYLKNIVP